MEAPSRLQGPSPPTRAPILEILGSDGTTVRVEDLLGRTDIVHNHFKELFTDPRHEEGPHWLWQRWPHEVLNSLPTIDSKRVREAAYAFRKRTSCAEDHLVIEMLRGLDENMWQTLARCFHFRLLNRWTEDEDMLWARQLVRMVKKKNGKLTMRGFRPIAMLPTMYRLYSKVLQQLAGQVIHTLRRIVEQANEWADTNFRYGLTLQQLLTTSLTS